MRSFYVCPVISLSLATKREIWKSESMPWKTILMRSFWYQKFEDPTIHVTVATCAKFWGFKFQNGFPHAKWRGRDPIFRYCPIIRTWSFTWASQNKFLTTPCKSPVLFRPSANTSYTWTIWARFTRVSLTFFANLTCDTYMLCSEQTYFGRKIKKNELARGHSKCREM